MNTLKEIRSELETMRKLLLASPNREVFIRYRDRFNSLARQYNSFVSKEFVIIDDIRILEGLEEVD